MADLAEDCLVFLREFDKRDVDPIATALRTDRFCKHLQKEYMNQRMSTRGDTYTSKVAAMLKETAVLVADGKVIVCEDPSREEKVLAMARIANVAAACRLSIQAEFPRFSVQKLLACFLLPVAVTPVPEAVTPSEDNCTRLRLLVRYLQWSPEREAQTLALYHRVYPVVAAKRATLRCSSRDAWALVLAKAPKTNDLRVLICMVIGFLVSETECERLFSVAGNRKKACLNAAEATQFTVLKCKVDGLPLSVVAPDGEPVGLFWDRIQSAYAKLHGVRRMQRLKEYSNKGKKRKTPESKTKNTVTNFTRQRLKRIRFLCRSARATANPEAVTPVFSQDPVALAEVREAQERLRQENTAFEKIAKTARAKTDKKRVAALALVNRVPGAARLSAPSSAQLSKAKRMKRDLRDRLLGCRLRGTEASRIQPAAFRAALGGPPLYYVVDSAHLEGRGLDEPFAGERPLSEFCFSRSLGDYVALRERYTTRVFLTPSLSRIPIAVQVAAILMGAAIQQQACTPAVRYKRLWDTLCCKTLGKNHITVGYTAAFAEAEKDTIAVLRNAAVTPAWGVVWFPRKRFQAEWAKCGEKDSAAEKKRWSLLCEGPGDTGIPGPCASIARTAREFVSQLARAVAA